MQCSEVLYRTLYLKFTPTILTSSSFLYFTSHKVCTITSFHSSFLILYTSLPQNVYASGSFLVLTMANLPETPYSSSLIKGKVREVQMFNTHGMLPATKIVQLINT